MQGCKAIVSQTWSHVRRVYVSMRVEWERPSQGHVAIVNSYDVMHMLETDGLA